MRESSCPSPVRFGVTVLQQVRQLIVLAVVYSDLDAAGVVIGFLLGPGLLRGAGCRGAFFFDHLHGFLCHGGYGFFDRISDLVGIYIEFFGDSIH